MKELSLNILDVAGNSVKAGAKNIAVTLEEDERGILTLVIKDDGCGMSEEMVQKAVNPFTTTRTTRKVGLGLPFLKLAAEQTGGEMKIKSKQGVGTEVFASFDTKHIDFMPLGDIVSTVTTLIMGSPDIDFLFTHKTPELNVSLDTRELREVLGPVPLSEPDVIVWIKENLNEQYNTK